jgi:HSP20 family protein
MGCNHDHIFRRPTRRTVKPPAGARRADRQRLATEPDSKPGSLPPINVFQKGDDVLAIIELPGIEKSDLQIQAKENTIRISGKKTTNYPDGSVHRRERVFGEFDRTLSLPIQLDPDRIKAEYRDGVLALLLPRAESEKPRTIKIT